MKGYIKLRKEAFWILNSKLSEKLYYHSAQHTVNALKDCEIYLKFEKVDSYNAKLLRIGVLFHDIGFTSSHINHEVESVKIAFRLMKDYGFSKKEFEVVEGLIYATRIEQTPNTLLEKIIKDVDLDYLGRNDYYSISDELYKELKIFSGYFPIEHWYERQIEFLNSHKYYTSFALKNRQPLKERRIEELYVKLLKNKSDGNKY